MPCCKRREPLNTAPPTTTNFVGYDLAERIAGNRRPRGVWRARQDSNCDLCLRWGGSRLTACPSTGEPCWLGAEREMPVRQGFLTAVAGPLYRRERTTRTARNALVSPASTAGLPIIVCLWWVELRPPAKPQAAVNGSCLCAADGPCTDDRSIAPSFHPEELEHAAVAVLLSEEAARVVQAFFAAEQAVLARAAVRYEHAGRLVVVVSGRR